jgi:hypothetical protein
MKDCVGENGVQDQMKYCRRSQTAGEDSLWKAGLLEWGYRGVGTKEESILAWLVEIRLDASDHITTHLKECSVDAYEQTL